jgi:hypothetical protein
MKCPWTDEDIQELYDSAVDFEDFLFGWVLVRVFERLLGFLKSIVIDRDGKP